MASTKSSKKTNGLKFPYTYHILSLILIILGAALIVYPVANKALATITPTIKQQVISTNTSSKPAKLYIPKLTKILYISNGQVVGDRWAISETGVSYLVSSALPGQTGNSVIYGHNRNDILGYLPKVTSGDPVYVVLANGDYVKYEVAETKVIQPSQVEILNQSQDSRLTIYTCTGFLDTARFVVVAEQIDKLI